jgi:hypothetical protein
LNIMHIYIIYWVSAITNLKDSTERTLSKASFEDGAEVGTQKSEEDIEEGVQEDELETLKKAPKKMGWKRWRIFRGVKKKASRRRRPRRWRTRCLDHLSDTAIKQHVDVTTKPV